MDQMITCPMCSTRFDAKEHPSCGNCPIESNCAQTCCPKCGFIVINPAQSKIVQLLSTIAEYFQGWFLRINQGAGPHEKTDIIPNGEIVPLTEIRPGQKAWFIRFLDGLPEKRVEHLRAFGLHPDQEILVIQQTPITVVQIDHTEIALERNISKRVQVKTEGV